ncbi:hypothetical protein BDV59DRAFT_53693 [Aspergillus ambiguus]|uniref:uncharacterized protein n=1 Tax=Aspergillus ambiguus TaxID=176160 RepID=UPI003CCE06A0
MGLNLLLSHEAHSSVLTCIASVSNLVEASKLASLQTVPQDLISRIPLLLRLCKPHKVLSVSHANQKSLDLWETSTRLRLYLG